MTCDNASNNTTMLAEFALRYRLKTGKKFDVEKRHIRSVNRRQLVHGHLSLVVDVSLTSLTLQHKPLS